MKEQRSEIYARQADLASRGWLYALCNSEFKRPLLKIGMTTTSPHRRAHELGSATGVPGKFDIVYFIHAVNRGQAEVYVHQRLADYRTTGEFFDAPIGVAVDAMDEVANHFAINMDFAQPKKRGGWGDKWLPQAFRHAVGPCPHCGKKNKIHMLAVPFIPRSGSVAGISRADFHQQQTWLPVRVSLALR